MSEESMMADLRELRSRCDELETLIASYNNIYGANPQAFVGLTVKISRYPTTVGAWMGVVPAVISGSEIEGQTPTVTAIAGAKPVLCYNAQQAVPAVGAVVGAKCNEVDGRWII